MLEDQKLKIALANLGPLGNNWQGGVSFEPYCQKFNHQFKERVRNFFGRICLLCNKPESMNITTGGKKQRLAVHHIMFDKAACCNGSPKLFAPLCLHCRTIADRDRDCTGVNMSLIKIIDEKYNGQCYEEMNSL